MRYSSMGGGIKGKSKAVNDLCIRREEYPSPNIFCVC